MGSFGERLRREREMRGIQLDEIAAATKIGSRSLRALEEEDFAKLPGGIFNKGFVRAYAKFLGIDEEQAVADYLAASNEDPNLSLDAGQLRRAAEKKLEASPRVDEEASAKPATRWAPWVLLAVLVALVAGLAFMQTRIRGAVVSVVHRVEQRLGHKAPAAPPIAPSAPAGQQQSAPSPAQDQPTEKSVFPAPSIPDQPTAQ